MAAPTAPLLLAELGFIKEEANHKDFCRKLGRLGLKAAEAELAVQAHAVGLRWLKLSREHLREARLAANSRARRTTYSRAYYAAYNASKAVRYIATGAVSLKGDDHVKAPELPGDFPDSTRWGASITRLYEHRLRADYDNWLVPRTTFGISPAAAVKEAGDFVKACQQYLESKFGLRP